VKALSWFVFMRKIFPLPFIEFIPFAEIREDRPTLLVTSAPAWTAVQRLLHLPVVCRLEITQASVDAWDSQLATFPAQLPEVVYAVGGGLPADAAKYMAAKLNLPLVCLPTALSVDAFFTWASGIRKDGCVLYLETKPPEILCIDLEVIHAAPFSIRSAGICDVLSIATGCWDWRFAHQQGMNPPGMEFIPYVYESAQAILLGALDCAEAAGAGDPAGLKQLLDCLCLEVQLCNQIGHARPEEGSEHYFAYVVENYTAPGMPHGELVGPGILCAARWQGQDVARLEKALRLCHIALDKIPPAVIEQTTCDLPSYCTKHNLPYGIAHTLKR
jgi:glycerol-1-phosphate dehydrogenase [NAD(P)+]